MLEVDQIHECKRLFGQGLSLREIARRVAVSRNTVRRYVRDGKVPGKYDQQRSRKAPVRERIEPIVRQLLEQERLAGAHRKQRLTGTRVHEILKSKHGIDCAETTVRRAMREIKAAKADPLANAFLTLQYEPGHDAQVDFFEADVLKGQSGNQGAPHKTRQHFLLVRMCYSRKLFVYAAPNQTREALLEGLMSAFEYFGGVPRVLWFDNLTPVVKKVLSGRTRQLQDAFAAFQAHYGFDAEFCRPASGNEKGGVENGVRHVQRRALSPMPVVADRRALQELCLSFCERDSSRVPRGCEASIATAFNHEQPELMPVPIGRFDPAPISLVRVTNKGVVRHGTNAYSVPIGLVNREVHMRVDAERVRIYCDGLVAEHARCYERQTMVLDIEHFLPLLERKGRGAARATVVHRWTEAQRPSWSTLLRVLQERHGSYQGGIDFVAAIRLCIEHGAERVTAAVEAALGREAVSLASIRYHLGLAVEKAARASPAIEYASPSVRSVSPNQYNDMLGVTCG